MGFLGVRFAVGGEGAEDGDCAGNLQIRIYIPTYVVSKNIVFEFFFIFLQKIRIFDRNSDFTQSNSMRPCVRNQASGWL